jgi:hypothetical protein
VKTWFQSLLSKWVNLYRYVEMITPFYPQKFLLLATIANVGKSVVGRCTLNSVDP